MIQARVNPFNTFRAHRKAWAGGVLTLLLGSWLSVFCLHCLAVAAANGGQNILAHSQERCHSIPAQQDQQNLADPCKGACDCTTLAAVPEKPQDPPAILVSAIPDLSYLAPGDEFASFRMIVLGADTPLYRNPDHSTLLPFETFRVLLI